MPEQLSTDDVLKEVPKRDENGDLIAEPRTISWKGSEMQVKVVPVTVGHINRYERQTAGDYDQMDLEAIWTIVSEHFHEPDFESMGREKFEDLPGARLIELMEAFDLGDIAEDGGAGNR